jgi:HK97 family phage major capsid protein
MWIKYKSDTKAHKAGEVVEVTEAPAAKALIDNDLAEETQAPKTVTDAATALEGSLKEFVTETATKTAEKIVADIRGAAKAINGIPLPKGGDSDDVYAQYGVSRPFALPANVKRYGNLRGFKGTSPDGRPAEQRAYEFGMWMLGMFGLKSAIDFCKTKGYRFVEDLEGKVQRENVNVSSGFLVPEQFENDLIDLRETYGVFRREAKIVPMSSDTRSDPRRTGGLTVYVVGESTSPTASDKTWDRVRLTARKIGVLTKYTNELREDAVLNIGDDLAQEIAYAFSKFEDDCGFVGDGTSTYAGIVGVTRRLTNLNGVDEGGGLILGAGNLMSELTLANHNSVVGLLPEYAHRAGPKWFCSQTYWGAVMQKLTYAAGGTTATEVVNGVRSPTFLGYPVVITQTMPVSDNNSQIVALFGNLRMAARFGDRRSTAIRMSDHALNTFEQDEVAIVGFERFDINVHDVGTTTAAGPIVGLISASS